MSKLTEVHQTIAKMEAKIAELVAASQAALELVGIVTAERDALAASNNKLTDALFKIANWNECTAEFRMNYGSNGERDFYRGIAQSVLHESPQHHLAAHDAEVAAKAVEDAAKRLMCGWVIKYDDLLEYADELRTKK